MFRKKGKLCTFCGFLFCDEKCRQQVFVVGVGQKRITKKYCIIIWDTMIFSIVLNQLKPHQVRGPLWIIPSFAIATYLENIHFSENYYLSDPEFLQIFVFLPWKVLLYEIKNLSQNLNSLQLSKIGELVWYFCENSPNGQRCPTDISQHLKRNEN